MKNIKEKIIDNKLVIIILAIIIVLQVVARVYIGEKKEYFHMDEMYSYGLMNYNKLNIADNDDFYNNWHNKQYYKDYLEVNSDEVWNLKPVYENQKNDVHPPLFYLLLRIASTFTVDNFTKWSGIWLNIIISIASTILTFLIVNKLCKNKYIALIASAFSTFTIIGLSATMYIRMYELANFNILLLVYTQLNLIEKVELKFKDCIPVIIALLLGGLTHYYFFIFAFVIYIMYAIKCIKEKKFKNLGIFTGAMVVAAIIFLLIFPFAINHVLFSYRGLSGGGEVKYTEKIKEFRKILKESMGGEYLKNILIVSIILYIVNLIRKRKFEESKILWVLLPTIAYFLMVAKNAPYIEIRYIIPIASTSAICVCYIIWTALQKYTNEKIAGVITTILCAFLVVMPIKNANFNLSSLISYDYTQFNHIADRIKEENLPIIYIFDKSNNRFLDDLYLFTLTENSIIIDSEKIDEFEDEINNQKSYILMCNNEEIAKEFLQNKNSTHMQHMNACDIWKINN